MPREAYHVSNRLVDNRYNDFYSIGLIAVVISLIIRTYRRKTATGKEDLKGRVAIVVETLKPQGVVSVEGELWNAVSKSGVIEPVRK